MRYLDFHLTRVIKSPVCVSRVKGGLSPRMDLRVTRWIYWRSSCIPITYCFFIDEMDNRTAPLRRYSHFRELTNNYSKQNLRNRSGRGVARVYFPANSFFTASLTTFPSTRMPWAANFAMAVFMTVPMSFMVGESISAVAAFTPATISASPAGLGR